MPATTQHSPSDIPASRSGAKSRMGPPRPPPRSRRGLQSFATRFGSRSEAESRNCRSWPEPPDRCPSPAPWNSGLCDDGQPAGAGSRKPQKSRTLTPACGTPRGQPMLARAQPPTDMSRKRATRANSGEPASRRNRAAASGRPATSATHRQRTPLWQRAEAGASERTMLSADLRMASEPPTLSDAYHTSVGANVHVRVARNAQTLFPALFQISVTCSRPRIPNERSGKCKPTKTCLAVCATDGGPEREHHDGPTAAG